VKTKQPNEVLEDKQANEMLVIVMLVTKIRQTHETGLNYFDTQPSSNDVWG